MRILPLVVVLIAAPAFAALPRIAAKDAAQHRGEHVTLVGPVSQIESRPDGTVLMIGSESPVPVRVAPDVRKRLGSTLGSLRGRELQLTGSLTPADRPLELVPDRPEQIGAPESPDEVERLRARVRELEDEVARLRGATPEDLKLVTYGSQPARGPLPLYTTQTTVLGERGVPSRVEWSGNRRILYYDRERWTFDANGQLIGVERN